MKNATKGFLLGVGILIWFIASFIGLIYTSSMNEEIWTVAIVGQYFFVFGLFVLSIFKEKVAIIFIIVGTVVMIGACINLYGTQSIVNLFNEKGIPKARNAFLIGVKPCMGCLCFYYFIGLEVNGVFRQFSSRRAEYCMKWHKNLG